jgi:integrase
MSKDDLDITPTCYIPSATLPALAALPPDQNPAAIYLASLGESSRRTMGTALNTIAGILGYGECRDEWGRDTRYLAVPWAALRYQHTAAIQVRLQARYAPATANKLLTALRRVLHEARRMGQIDADDFAAAIDLPVIQTPRLPRGRLVTDAEILALMQVCARDKTPAGARDAAIIGLLRGTGLRRSEAAALDLVDFEPARGAVMVRREPGQKNCVVYAPAGARAALQDWLSARDDAPGPLFYGVVKGGRLVARRLAGQAIAVICANRAAEADIAPFTPHDLRRTFITGLFDTGADVAVVQRLAGHANQAATSRYDRRSEEVKRRAVDLVHIPHVPR